MFRSLPYKDSKMLELLEELDIKRYTLRHDPIWGPKVFFSNPKDYYRLVKKLSLKSTKIRTAPDYVDVLLEKLDTTCHGWTFQTVIGKDAVSKDITNKLKKEKLLRKKTLYIEYI